ncbi:hypothetical protein ACHAQJ_004142 [Trichoderma viride]
MYKAIALTSIAALAGQSMALNAHRHQHQMDKRVLKTDWCTVWETVYVTVDPAGSTAASSTATGFAAQDVPNPTGVAAGAVVPTVTSTSTVVVASSTAAASSAVAAATQATTLVTAVRQSSAAPVETSSAPAVASSAPVSSAAPPTTAAPQPTSEKATPTPSPSSVETPSSSAAPPPSSTSQAAPSATPSKAASPPPSSGGSSGKRGMAYNDGTLANAFGALSGKISWGYNWGFYPSGIDTSKYSYIPTLWSPAPEHSNGFAAQVETLLASGTKAIFSFNEPDIPSQANMSPGDAASAHAQWLNQYSGKALIGAPAVSNSNIAGQGLDWLQSFVESCAGNCEFDFCNIHWYSPASAIDTLFDQISSASKICGGKPVYITEFAPSGSDDEIASFLEQALPQLDSNPSVMGYSYFMVGTGSLMSSATALSTYGLTYATS